MVVEEYMGLKKGFYDMFECDGRTYLIKFTGKKLLVTRINDDGESLTKIVEIDFKPVGGIDVDVKYWFANVTEIVEILNDDTIIYDIKQLIDKYKLIGSPQEVAGSTFYIGEYENYWLLIMKESQYNSDVDYKIGLYIAKEFGKFLDFFEPVVTMSVEFGDSIICEGNFDSDLLRIIAKYVYEVVDKLKSCKRVE